MYYGHIEQDICFGIVKFSLVYIICVIIKGCIEDHFRRKEARELFEKITKDIRNPIMCRCDTTAHRNNAENN